jgi:hypothetical protein
MKKVIPPEGVIVGVPNGCKGPLETAYDAKVPKIDCDTLAKQTGQDALLYGFKFSAGRVAQSFGSRFYST